MITKYYSRAFYVACLFIMTSGSAYSDGVSNVVISPSDTIISTPTTFTLSAEVSQSVTPTNPLVKESVLLYETTDAGKLVALVGKMYDDGDHGDKIANDGVYTVQIVVNEANPLNRYYKVTAAYSGIRNRYSSEIRTMKVFPLLPDEIVDQSFLAVETIQNNFYANVSRLGLTGARAEALAEALADPNIGPGNAKLSGAYLSIYYVYIDPVSGYKSKIGGTVSLSDPALPTAGSGLSSPINIPVDVKLPANDKLLIYAPFYSQNYRIGADAAKTKFGYRQFMEFVPNPPVIMSDSNASLDVVKTWGDYGTVIITTHGAHWDLEGIDTVIMTTGTPKTKKSPEIKKDLDAFRIFVGGSGNYVITPSYIDEYVQTKNNTFYYLGFCDSLRNNTMWDMLQKRGGAKIAFGFDESILVTFVESTLDKLLTPMLPTGGTTNPMNAKEAYDAILLKQDNNVSPPGNFLMKTASAEWGKLEFVYQSKPITLTVTGTKPGYTLPAEISLSNFYPVSAANFDIFGTQGNTCGSGERGSPIFSKQVDAFADFFGAITVRGVPDQISGPGINLKPCSSFYANKRNAAGLGKVWINATGRARQSNSVVTSDWEYQVRYYSGDPSTNYSDRSCTLGVVPNSGTYIGTPVTCNVACDNNLFGKLPANSPACN